MTHQSKTKSHISYCVIAKSNIIHMGTHAHHPISSSHTYLSQLDLLWISHTNNDRTL